MHNVKKEAYRIKNCLLRGELSEMGKALNMSWNSKKKMAPGISNPSIDRTYDAAIAAGALGGKISGAGGGGFMFFYCPANTRYAVIRALNELKLGTVWNTNFSQQGLTTWKTFELKIEN
jgi:D-glycero-alpha-D-manno-heptose-7-phosphate kinase